MALVTALVCLVVLVAHTKNWVQEDGKVLRIRTGFYHSEVPLAALDSVSLLERLPPMKRLRGFSALDSEKGIFQEFKDSLTDKEIPVYVDNITQPKIALVYNDSLKLYFNLKDSTATQRAFERLRAVVGNDSVQQP